MKFLRRLGKGATYTVVDVVRLCGVTLPDSTVVLTTTTIKRYMYVTRNTKGAHIIMTITLFAS